MNSSITENTNFWDDNVCTDGNIDYVNMKLRTKLDQISSEIYEYQLNEDSNKEDVSTAVYVAKTLSIRSSCIHCKEKLLLDDENNEHDNGKYMQLLSLGELTVPSLS